MERRYAVLFKREDGSIGDSGHYRYKGKALRVAKENNECKFLYYAGTYFVKDLETGKVIKEEGL